MVLVGRCLLAPQGVQLGQEPLVGRLELLDHGLRFGRSLPVEAQLLDALAQADQVLFVLYGPRLEAFEPAGNDLIHAPPTSDI